MTAVDDGWVLDRDPGYVRPCVALGCEASFSMFEVMTGQDDPAGWVQLSALVWGYLCPPHAAPVTRGEHVPSWGRDPAGDVVRSVVCACGWMWSPGAYTAAVQSDYQSRWVWHLADGGGWDHGSSAYRNHRCRCPACRRGYADDMVAYRRRRMRRRRERMVHGKFVPRG